MHDITVEYDVLALDSLLGKVYRDGGYDFRDYKRGTITRRLARRLYATKTETYQEYMQFLDSNPDEYQKLADDFTIKVSSFFRNSCTFQQISSLVLPELLSYKEARDEREIRFWSTSCARGQEPYSVAIALAESLVQRQEDFDVLIYATDISQWALNEAQSGLYSSQEIETLSPAILRKYFIQNSQHYEVRHDIRQMVKFSRFDLTSTTSIPFTKIDCVFCCNVLIYWQKQLQERVLSMLYNALEPPGYLVLGEAETPPNSIQKNLKCLDSKAKIYKKTLNCKLMM